MLYGQINLPSLLMMLAYQKLAHNKKKSNVEGHFQNKHTAFAVKDKAGYERKQKQCQMFRKAQQSKKKSSLFVVL